MEICKEIDQLYREKINEFFNNQLKDTDQKAIDDILSYFSLLKKQVDRETSFGYIPKLLTNHLELIFMWTDYQIHFIIRFNILKKIISIEVGARNKSYFYEIKREDEINQQLKNDLIKYFRLREFLSPLYNQIHGSIDKLDDMLKNRENIKIVVDEDD